MHLISSKEFVVDTSATINFSLIWTQLKLVQGKENVQIGPVLCRGRPLRYADIVQEDVAIAEAPLGSFETPPTLFNSPSQSKLKLTAESSILLKRLHQDIITVCFEHLYEVLFIPFTGSPMLTELYKSLCGGDPVGEWDFDFFTRMGAGGFGSIFSCRKRSTGAMYAMKIQPKSTLLKMHKHTHLGDVMIEALVCTSCRHPYICEAEYAFQNSKLVFLAMPIYACGDLRRALLMEPSGCFSRDRAQFYIAVVASVLMYLHTHGLIYRDLKPENLLLHSDGHIALCDLGSIAGKVF